MVEPPPLPSAGDNAGHSHQAPPGDRGPDVDAAPAPAVPWSADPLRPLIDELVKICEGARVENLASKAREAKLPDTLCREIAKDSAYPVQAKGMICAGGASVAAKALNKAGIGAENADVVTLLGGLIIIRAQGQSLEKKLEELIQKAKPQEEKEA
jgi:hypothetical protein